MSYDVLPAHESTRRRRRWGCTCGCLTLLTVLFILGSLTTYFQLRPKDAYAQNALMDPTIDGFGVLRIDKRDVGIDQMIDLIFNRLEKAQDAKLTGQDAQMMSAVLKVAKQFVSSMVQQDSMIYMSYDPTAATEEAMLSIPMKHNLSYMFANRMAEEHAPAPYVERKGDATVYPLSAEKLSSGSVISVSPESVIVSNNLNLVTRGLQKTEEGIAPTEPQAKLQKYIDELGLDQPATGEDLALAFVNEPGRITKMLLTVEEWIGFSGVADKIQATVQTQGVKFDDLDGVKITGDLATADLLTLEMTCYASTSEMAARFAEAAKTLIAGFTGQPLPSGLTLTAESAARGSTAVVKLNIAGLKTWAQKKIPVPEAATTATATAQ